jgi:hypothetical protein
MTSTTSAPAVGLVPLISNREKGPLGLIHLPRLWLKMRAFAVGLLPEGYRHGAGGFDELLLTAIGADLPAVEAFIAEQRPDYLKFEAWLKANARTLTPEAIAAFNERVLSMHMPEPRRTEWQARFGLTGTDYDRGVDLNQLDDWAAVRDQIVAGNVPLDLIYPAIATPIVGPLGLIHLPRLWLKHLLHGAGCLQNEYRHGASGVDLRIAEDTGFDPDEFREFVEGERPHYLAAEAWVRANATKLTPEIVEELRLYTTVTKMPAELEAQRRARLGHIDPGFGLGYELNQLDDWYSIHEQLIAIA